MEDFSIVDVLFCYIDRGLRLSKNCPWSGKWLALSQYGYTLGEFDTQKEAEGYVLRYYMERPNLILQFGGADRLDCYK